MASKSSARERVKAALRNKDIKLKDEMKEEQAKRAAKSSGGAPHIVVVARAGTGKTTTCCGGIRRLCNERVDFTPSAQQKDIWDSMALEEPSKILVCAFSKAIQLELEKRLPFPNVETRTCHSFGNQIIRGDTRTKFSKMEEYKNLNLIEQITKVPSKDFNAKKIPGYVTSDLVRSCKQNLVAFSDLNEFYYQCEKLVVEYDIDLRKFSLEEVVALAQQVLFKSTELTQSKNGKYYYLKEYDFEDMIWLPIAMDMDFHQEDLIIVDEAQDLNRCQQEFCLRLGRRIVLVGDPKQAIFAFAGADSDSMPRMQQRLVNTDRGCQVFPLNTTYRCGRKIVELANKIVPDYFAYEKNPEGSVTFDYPEESLLGALQDDNMVICRTNAPLVSLCFRLLKSGKKARIQGRDIGKGLLDLVNKLKGNDIDDLKDKLAKWYVKEHEKLLKKKFPSEPAIIALEDKVKCVATFIDNCESVPEVQVSIQRIFNNTGSGVLLTSGHRSKGLEAEHVYIIHPELLPHPMAKTATAREQEENLRYVMITRAIQSLTFVKTTPKTSQDNFLDSLTA